MNRIDLTFDTLKKQNKKALITFITAGDPDLSLTEKLVLAMEEAGADLIELGVPFSDPVAEGPTIQASSQRALESGTKLSQIFSLVARLRERTQIPLPLMMYLNPVCKYGKEDFFAACKNSGIDGIIIPDLPFEEKDELEETAEKYGIYIIDLVAPTSGTRIPKIATGSRGFLYCISSLGVTGERTAFQTDFLSFFREIRQHTKTPLALGFGISSPDQVRALKEFSDGVIVGSAIVKIVEEHGKEAVPHVKQFVRELKQALG